MAFDRSFPQSLASQAIADSEHFWPRLRCSPHRLKTASAFGSIDCVLRLHLRLPDTLPASGSRSLRIACGHKLSSHFHSHFTPDTYGFAYGVGFVPIPVCPETYACYSEPSMPGCRTPSSISHGCHTVSNVPPTHRGRSRLHSKPPALFIIRASAFAPSLRCRLPPSPDARCDDALAPLRQSANHSAHSESAYGLEQGQVGLLSAVQAPRQKACRYVPPRHLPFALIHL